MLLQFMKLSWKLFNCSPIELTDQIEQFEINLLAQAFFCVLTPKIGHIFFAFGSILDHFFALIRIHFTEFIDCIAKGSLSFCEQFKENIPDELLKKMDAYMIKHYAQGVRQRRAQELSEIDSFAGMVPKLWPNILYVATSVSGSFSVFEDSIRYHLGDVPLMGAVYMSSEASIGFQFNIQGEYLFHPDTAFFEFIPEDQISEKNPTTLLLSELEVGKRYEILVTTKTGFYRYRIGDVVDVVSNVKDKVGIPLFKISYRTGSILDAFGEKTTEDHIVTSLNRTAETFNCKLVNFTTSIEIQVSPVIYVIYAQFSIDFEKEREEEVTDEMDRQLRKVQPLYDDYRNQKKMGKLKCKIVDGDKFSQLRDLCVEAGTAPFQFKIPRLLKKPSHIELFNN